MAREKPSIKINRTLADCSLEELELFANIANSKDFHRLEDFIGRQIDFEKEYVFRLPEEDTIKLAVQKAFSRGQVAGLKNLVYIIRNASAALEKRLIKN